MTLIQDEEDAKVKVLNRAACLWFSQGSERALRYVANCVFQGKGWPGTFSAIMARGNQLLTLSGQNGFDLRQQLSKFYDELGHLA
jgi:hypothetical protein